MNTVSLRHDEPSDTSRNDAVDLVFVPSCASTNDLVLHESWSHKKAPWVLATFDQQKGRGRQGRVWANRPGDSLALSLVWRPRLHRDLWGWYTLATALACVDVIGPEACIKWPNDVVDVRFRKMAGILAHIREGVLVVGVGVNLRGAIDLEDPLLARAATMAQTAPRWAERCETLEGRQSFARELAVSMQRVFTELEDGESGKDLIYTRYSVKCITVGRSVWVDTGCGQTEVQDAEGIDRYGHLFTRRADGTTHTLTAADVHLMPPSQNMQTLQPAQACEEGSKDDRRSARAE